MFYIPKMVVNYKEMKSRLFKGLIGFNIIVISLLYLFQPDWVLRYAMGAFLGYVHVLTLCFSAEFPKKALAAVFSVFRMLVVSFLIVYLGKFEVLETSVVFCGFLSYKVVLVLEFVRHSVGIKLNSGK